MGPTRAANSWKPEANHKGDKLVQLRGRAFAGVREVEERMAELQAVHDEVATGQAGKELEKVRKVWRAVESAGGSFLALDVGASLALREDLLQSSPDMSSYPHTETWEMDHNLLTEFGSSRVTFGAGATPVREVAHFGERDQSRGPELADNHPHSPANSGTGERDATEWTVLQRLARREPNPLPTHHLAPAPPQLNLHAC
jgi:hypothetical protein